MAAVPRIQHCTGVLLHYKAQWRNFAPMIRAMSPRARTSLALVLALALCLSLCVAPTSAALTYQFKGAIDGSWENPGNWAPALPGPTSAPSHKPNPLRVLKLV